MGKQYDGPTQLQVPLGLKSDHPRFLLYSSAAERSGSLVLGLTHGEKEEREVM